jgi:hypothetical protein
MRFQFLSERLGPWSWPQCVWWHRLERAASISNWTRNYENACFCEEILKDKKRSISPEFSTWFLQVLFRDPSINTFIYWRQNVMIHVTRVQFKRNAPSNCNLSVHIYFYSFHKYECLCQNRLAGTTLHIYKTDWLEPPSTF